MFFYLVNPGELHHSWLPVDVAITTLPEAQINSAHVYQRNTIML